MRKVIVVDIAALALEGCAGLLPWIQQHAAGIALTGTVLGTLAAGESAVVNGIELGREIRK